MDELRCLLEGLLAEVLNPVYDTLLSAHILGIRHDLLQVLQSEGIVGEGCSNAVDLFVTQILAGV